MSIMITRVNGMAFIGNVTAFQAFAKLHGGFAVNPIICYHYYKNKYGWTRRFSYAGNTVSEEKFSSESEALTHAVNWVSESPLTRVAYGDCIK